MFCSNRWQIKNALCWCWALQALGKPSLVRAGILPVLTQAGIIGGNRSWRLAFTRPADGGAGDPFDALAVALLKESALPEFPDAASPNGWKNLAAELRDPPENAALRLRETLQHLSVQGLDHFLDQHSSQFFSLIKAIPAV